MSSASDFSNDDESKDPTYFVPQKTRKRLYTSDDTKEDGLSSSKISAVALADLTDSSTLLASTSSESAKCSPRSLLFEHFFSITTKSNETKTNIIKEKSWQNAKIAIRRWQAHKKYMMSTSRW